MLFQKSMAQEIGSIIWEFNALWMRLIWEGRNVELRRAKGPSNKIKDGRDFGEQLRRGKRAYLLQLNSLNLEEK